MKINRLYILGGFVSLILSTSCVDGINEDPNRPSSVPTTSLITSSQKLLVDNLRSEQVSLRGSMLFVQYFAQNTYTTQSRYDIPFSYSDDYWKGLYKTLNNLEEVIKLNTDPATKEVATANGVGRNATQIAISRVLKTYAFYALTDVFGDVPYQSYGNKDADFQALQQNPENITPKYAAQEKIYTDLLNELKAAGDTLIKYQSETTFGGADIIYAGSNQKWAKLANSLRLRFATRLKEKNPSLYQEHFQDALNKGVFVSNGDNASFKYSATSPNEAPLYRATVTANRKDFAVSRILVDLLKGANPVLPVADPRLPIYALPATNTNTYVGLPYGLANDQASKFAATDVSLPGAVVNSANYSEVLMEYAEVAFLISEYKNWSQADYQAGVQASLEKWGVAATDVTTYLGKLPAANQKNVLTQKYIALYMQGLEAWSEYRRTGYPDFLAKEGDVVFQGTIEGSEVTYRFDPLFGDGGVPSRLYYPTKEQNVNKANYQQALSAQGNDKIETKPWVFKK
ncbi:SusD/RagB family nutrient-binding outer membrane lipoprotein [Dysgonomonas sp. Marseille-P4677]|uniref:SusD/RagB family nutrient-binding outer membrane lipoprotein n=1 Tax=Dysgonomonas sp. Marseille-P4677 TaxID=2364790 RepID=UPI0019138F6E|nr:SusD/RagB family nutrient-binding outer membrane lipoprotein [Dysgonomonas sp. Marseille-P4677]MBK5721074.1 SusD/RagB family nutrient-binding outer membrane lipoprotein [Dysgonomonas sp. Marseille-P4677]